MQQRTAAYKPASVHDTELCAWWEAPYCNEIAYSVDLCRQHYNKVWWSGEHVPRFRRARLDALRKDHVLTAYNDETCLAYCTICGPDTRYKWAVSRKATDRRPESRRRLCLKAQASNHRWRETGWAEEDFDRALIRQGNRCAVCGKPPRGKSSGLHADHCHVGLRSRELLCGQCNQMLGLADDDPEVLRSAVAYLARNAEVPRLF